MQKQITGKTDIRCIKEFDYSDPDPFDWYNKYHEIKDNISRYVKTSNRILIVGCGSSCKH